MKKHDGEHCYGPESINIWSIGDGAKDGFFSFHLIAKGVGAKPRASRQVYSRPTLLAIARAARW